MSGAGPGREALGAGEGDGLLLAAMPGSLLRAVQGWEMEEEKGAKIGAHVRVDGWQGLL